MAPNTQRTTWCDDPIEGAVEPGKCPECGAALRIRGGANYCWFCEKEVDAPSERTFSPASRQAQSKDADRPSSIIEDLLDDKPPIIKGTIVFEDDEEEADEEDGESGPENGPDTDGEEFILEENANEEPVPEASPIEDDDVHTQTWMTSEAEDTASTMEAKDEDEVASGDPDEDVDQDGEGSEFEIEESEIDPSEEAQDEVDSDPAQPPEEEDWDADSAVEDIDVNGEAPIDDEVGAGIPKEEDASSSDEDDSTTGDESGDEFVIEEDGEDYEDLNDAESPYARGKKRISAP